MKNIILMAAASLMLSIASSCGSKTNEKADSDCNLCEPTCNANTEDIIANRNNTLYFYHFYIV